MIMQFAGTRQRLASYQSGINGNGWMAGPNAILRLSEHVFWQSRAAWPIVE